MTASAEPPATQQNATRQDISGAVTSVLVRHVRNRCGDRGVARLLALAAEPRSADVLENATSWSSHGEAVALFAAAAAVTGDRDVARSIGEEMLRQHDGTNVANLLRSLGSPGELLRNVAAALAKFSTVATMEPLEVGNAHAVVRAHTRAGFRRERCLCDLTKGLLSQVPVLFGLVPAEVAESECQADGGRFCLYSVAWEARQWSTFVDERTSLYTSAWHQADVVEARSEIATDDGARLAALRRHLEEMGRHLEGVYSTAADLLAAEDIDTVLARITARAAHAVNAPRYLLVVRTGADRRLCLHHHGFSEDEAQALADELLADEPDDRDGSRLIVDIASRRHAYGRLAAVFPDGVRFLADERRMLAVYANYAATALDVVSSLDEVRRSDATARALLDFSRALAQTSTTDGVATTLATTVPVAVGSDHSAVWLWDARAEAMRLRARSVAGSGIGRPAPGPSTAQRPDLAVLHRTDTTLIDRLVTSRDVLVVTKHDTEPALAALLEQGGTEMVAVAPMLSGGELLGMVTAGFSDAAAASRVRSSELHERMTGLADQAVTAMVNARLLEQVSHMAWHDALTGLPNRRLLEDRVNQELLRARRAGTPLCMFFVDLDRFKHVNDTLGHGAGDELIAEVARRLVDTVRSQDTVARLGGDELAVLLPDMGDMADIERLAQRSLEVLHAPYRVAGRELCASASIGIAMAPEHGQTYDELLSAADAAMYRAKSLGRNTYQVYRPDDGPDPADLELQADLAHAVARGELFVVYQPFVDLASGAIIGVEALARWAHPQRGLVEPTVFVPMAEASDAIVDIDIWVMTEACRQLCRWDAPGLRLAVNVSTRDLASDVFVRSVAQALADNGLEPERLEIEVTERVVVDDAGTIARNVERLRQLGVRFSIDDFGTGNSTLSRIGAFPVSTLKINQSFVQVLGPQEESAALVSAIVSMARDLGVDCVAEGVETHQQHRILLQRGCAAAQGFFFSPPLPADELGHLLAQPQRPALADAP